MIENNNPEDGISSDMRSNGFSVWPLSSEQLEIIRGFFSYADNQLDVGKPFNPSDLFPADDDTGNPMRELRFIMSETIVIGKFVDGTIIYYTDPALLPEVQIEFITVLEAKNRAYPRADTYPTSDDLAYWLVLHSLGGIKGDKGDNGAPGADGAPGAPGADGECLDCGPGGQPDGGGGGPPGGDGGGSGDGGEPNPDGGDKIVYISGCPDPILNFPYCSDSFSFSNANLRGAILSAVIATGHFDTVNDDLISVVLDWEGAAYAGVAELDGGPYDYTGPHSNLAQVLTVTDAEGNKLIVPHDIEDFGVTGVLVVRGYHYDGTTGLRMQPDSAAIPLDGQMSTYPILGTGNCHVPPDPSDPAWLKCCLRQFIKHAKAVAASCAHLSPWNIDGFTQAEFDTGCWSADVFIDGYGGVLRANTFAHHFVITGGRIYSNSDTTTLTVAWKFGANAANHTYNTQVTAYVHYPETNDVLGSDSHDVNTDSGGFGVTTSTIVFNRTLLAGELVQIDWRVETNDFDLGSYVHMTLS